MLTKLLFQFSFLKTFGNYEHVDVVPLQTHESGFLRILLESETYLLCMATMLWGPTLWAKTSTNADSWCRSMNRSPITQGFISKAFLHLFLPHWPHSINQAFLVDNHVNIFIFFTCKLMEYLSSNQVCFFCALLCCHYNPFLFQGP